MQDEYYDWQSPIIPEAFHSRCRPQPCRSRELLAIVSSRTGAREFATVSCRLVPFRRKVRILFARRDSPLPVHSALRDSARLCESRELDHSQYCSTLLDTAFVPRNARVRKFSLNYLKVRNLDRLRKKANWKSRYIACKANLSSVIMRNKYT